MSGSGGVSVARNRSGDRFYSPPAVRRHHQMLQQRNLQKQTGMGSVMGSGSGESETSTGPDNCSSSSSLTSSAGPTGASNLDRFLEYTTPVVAAQYFPKSCTRSWRSHEKEFHPYFVLGDLWESFKEWSAYGAGVPLLLDGKDSVVQYYVPYLSGIQLYIDPSRPPSKGRRAGEDSDTESSRESSSDGSSDFETGKGPHNVAPGTWNQDLTDANIQSLRRLSLRNKPVTNFSRDKSEHAGLLVFEYFEQDPPYSREPLADKISVLASRFPDLRTFWSCDLLPSSWISVAWYPIYRIPTGPTLQNLDACFLTYHSLSTPFASTSVNWLHFPGSNAREVPDADSFKLSLPIFGLASYKFKASVWHPNGVEECQIANSLLQAADNFLRHSQVNHPDYRFFISHSPYQR
ncbi:uncharacterized protein LOC131150762 [Malania oleifera]|uniref:uncharacterized protein LOC131150762 n=1 Tax=Malania oleifera TaxID=397392 RepID=UPI0025AEA028|nr:uncharacterized protein LOC131150762 [Malania oleifera]